MTERIISVAGSLSLDVNKVEKLYDILTLHRVQLQQENSNTTEEFLVFQYYSILEYLNFPNEWREEGWSE